MKSRYRSKLRNKAIAICSLFALSLSLLIGGFGYFEYRQSIEESYQNYAGTLVDIIAGKIDVPALAAVIESGVRDAAYDALQDEVNQIKMNSDAEYIYMISYPNGIGPGTIAYVMTGYTPEELLYEAETIRYLGDIAEDEDFGGEFRSQMLEHITGDTSEIRYFNNQTKVAQRTGSQTEYMMTAYRPVRNSSGELVCILCTDISMTRIYNNLHSYLMSMAVGAAVIVIVFLSLFLIVMNRQVIRPIKLIAERADDFVKQSHDVSDPAKLNFQAIQTRTKDEIQTLAESLNHTMKALIQYMIDMKTLSSDQERVAAELDVAKEIQRNLYPCVFPAFPERKEFEIYTKLEPVRGAGGDFYNFFFTDKNHLCMMIGCVSDSGIPTTMFAAITTTIMKSYAQMGYSPARIMAETNNQISNNNRAELDVSAFIGIINLESGRLTYVSAGDMTPLIKISGQAFEPLPHKKGIRLGAMEHVPYFQQSVGLVQGDMLFLYTAGVPETMDERGNLYTDSYIREQINEITKKEISLEHMIGTMSKNVAAFRGDQIQEQDYTMLMFRYYG